MTGPTVEFWQARFESGAIPWDRGAPSPQLLHWLESGQIKPDSRVLVPGCGRGWEVLALAQAGCQVTGIDYAQAALAECQRLLTEQKLSASLAQANVLEWLPPEPVDVVYEQTCLCALHPDYWVRYALQLQAWLKPAGRLCVLFMQRAAAGMSEGYIIGPPYHCDVHAMRALFPASHWDWPKPPYESLKHPLSMVELALILTRK